MTFVTSVDPMSSIYKTWCCRPSSKLRWIK